MLRRFTHQDYESQDGLNNDPNYNPPIIQCSCGCLLQTLVEQNRGICSHCHLNEVEEAKR